ncbi:hypothetical protein BFG07_02475 [Kosakonia cowanii]|nr:hypothetical protein BFG07_02475 [Kosakonia cowanii]
MSKTINRSIHDASKICEEDILYSIYPGVSPAGAGLADRIGVVNAARELALHDSQLNAGTVNNVCRAPSEREQQRAAENARLRRQITEPDEELAL